MTYHYENLSPETFQQFCKALLAVVFPEVQCFPVAQPDGGRDATWRGLLSLSSTPASQGFLVFQVKFLRNPASEIDPHKWLTEVLESEGPKIKKLIPEGAREYYLLTNIAGTAHPSVGSIDQVQKLLKQHVPIPAMCWWRDDLDRRLDSSWAVKWSYPALMRGDDILYTIIQSGISERREERRSAIMAYLADQYKDDEEVRFKQVELQNKLLDLFIDLPMSMHSNSAQAVYKFKRRGPISAALSDQIAAEDDDELFIDLDEDAPALHSRDGGAATMLLEGNVPYFLRAVVEGAPGQGKSTIGQYICQVHRMRILAKAPDLAKVPLAHKESPLRIPFRVDLRDLAIWFARKNPFSPDQEMTDADHWVKSLESFLAAQVRHHSGGLEFSVIDLHAIAKVSAILIVLDGLDEVADITARHLVVEEITKAVNRLQVAAASLQVIVTSRPAAFSNSPGFLENIFCHFSLRSVTRGQIDEYAGKWMDARRLTGKSRAEFKSILSEKLDQPHLRDLARNPMQLAILLSLIHTRGASLPDKRTALYDSYMELFFSRESEKSPIVREYRDLLIDLHQYLAWQLHAAAETGPNRGSVTVSELHALVEEYLRREGHDASIAATLFTGMIERVVALVSRVEGTFEFEVQPLREYFAARFLYETAPYSPPGAERRGTKPERFDAVSRNFYWLNVTRFLAGCFSKGELASLVDSLDALVEAEGYRSLSFPRSLAAMLLSDWVFAQQPKSVAKVLALILNDKSLRLLLATRSAREPFTLPERSGRGELVDHCLKILAEFPSLDYAQSLLQLVKSNCAPIEFQMNMEARVESATGNRRTSWLEYAVSADVLSDATNGRIAKLLSDDSESTERLFILMRAGRCDFCELTKQRFMTALNLVLAKRSPRIPPRGSRSTLAKVASAHDIRRYAAAFDDPLPVALARVNAKHEPPEDEKNTGAQCPKFDEGRQAFDFVTLADELTQRPAFEWSTELAPWSTLVEKSRELWGDSWATMCLANIAAGVKTKDDISSEFPLLFDYSRPLCERARYARSKVTSVRWWRTQLEKAESEIDFKFATLLLITWGTSRTLAAVGPQLEYGLNRIANSAFSDLMLAVRESVLFSRRGSPERWLLAFDVDDFPKDLTPRFAALLCRRSRRTTADIIYERVLSKYDGADRQIWALCQESALLAAYRDAAKWPEALRVIRNSFDKAITGPPGISPREQKEQMPVHIAAMVCETPAQYPMFLVRVAETAYTRDVGSRAVPVASTASDSHWFDEP